MKFTLSWLKEHLETDASLEDIVNTLSQIGLEVESVTNPGESLAPFKVVEVVSTHPHPDADKLTVCQVNTGSEVIQVVCGAPNAAPGKFIYAPIGAIIPTNGMKIKQAAIRGVDSAGMLCSSSELGLGTESDGIQELPADAPVGTSYVDYAQLDDPLIDIAITPNRGDCLGVYGIARDLAAAGLGTLKPIIVPTISSVFPNPTPITIETSACTQLAACAIRGITNGPSPEWLRRRLESVGEGSISAVVDITNYIMLTYGRPLHAYNAKAVHGTLTVRSAKSKESFKALDEESYELSDSMTVIADEQSVLGLAGIIGGMESGTWEDTTDILLESAWFDPIFVAMAGRALQIESGARYRFERHPDPALVLDGLKIAAQMIVDLCGGEISEMTHLLHQPHEERQLTVKADRFLNLVGYELPQAKMDQHLANLGFTCKRDAENLTVTVPSWRSDIQVPDQVIEEASRIEGYDKLPEVPMKHELKNTLGLLTLEQRRKQMVRRHLAARGVMEVVSWSFISEAEAERFHADPSLKIANPISQDLSVMRPSIVSSMLHMIARNHARQQKDLAFFEIGPQFSGQGPDQQEHAITLLATGHAVARQALDAERPIDAYDAKGWLMLLLNMHGVHDSSIRYDQSKTPDWYHPGQSTTIMLGKTPLAHVGTIHPSVAKLYDIDDTVIGFEFYCDRAPEPKRKKVYRGPLNSSEYQAVNRDFAFVVSQDQPVHEMLSSIKAVDKQLIRDVSLFDVYEGEHVESGKKSIALNVHMQADDRTLTDEEIHSISQKIIDQLAKKCQAVLRSS